MPEQAVTLLAGQQGVYEEQITADNPLLVTVEDGNYQALQVVHHDGDHPIYVGLNHTTTARDANARIVLPGTWLVINTGESTSAYALSIVSSGDAVVSVVRM